jgi:hypothetical protein
VLLAIPASPASPKLSTRTLNATATCRPLWRYAPGYASDGQANHERHHQTAIFPARRAIERAVAAPGAQPVRIFGVLVPVWRAEIRAKVQESEPYDVFDQFLTRGIAEAELTNPAALVRFFGVEPSLVERALNFLVSLGHVHRDGNTLTLTALGQRSARDDRRYILREDHRHLYFDGFATGPLPISHYSGVTYLSEPKSTQQEWLPAYLVQDAGPAGLQAFTMAVEDRDKHIESVCAHLRDALREEDNRQAPETAWRAWLDQKGHPNIVPRRLSNGILLAVLPASAFAGIGTFRLYQLGSFESFQRSFIQLWCTDEALRREAVLDRILTMTGAQRIRTRAELTNQLDRYAKLLEVAMPTTEDVAAYVRERDDTTALAILDTLG